MDARTGSVRNRNIPVALLWGSFLCTSCAGIPGQTMRPEAKAASKISLFVHYFTRMVFTRNLFFFFQIRISVEDSITLWTTSVGDRVLFKGRKLKKKKKPRGSFEQRFPIRPVRGEPARRNEVRVFV